MNTPNMVYCKTCAKIVDHTQLEILLKLNFEIKAIKNGDGSTDKLLKDKLLKYSLDSMIINLHTKESTNRLMMSVSK